MLPIQARYRIIALINPLEVAANRDASFQPDLSPKRGLSAVSKHSPSSIQCACSSNDPRFAGSGSTCAVSGAVAILRRHLKDR